MKLSEKGLALIKRFEGLRLKAYKAVPTEKYYTIGYGHYGADVSEGMEITEATANRYLLQDADSAVKAVNSLELALNQNQFDALVSFTFNCGKGNLKKLVKERSVDEIGEALLLYTKSGGKVLKGLVTRRNAEHDLFFTPLDDVVIEKYRIHTVVKGDTLSSIAKYYYGSSFKWRLIYDANKDVIKNPNVLRVGMQLKVFSN